MCVGYFCLSGCYLCCLLHKPKRQTLRGAYNLVEDPSDFLATCCCSACANCQEAREMQMRGLFDYSNDLYEIRLFFVPRCTTWHAYSGSISTSLN